MTATATPLARQRDTETLPGRLFPALVGATLLASLVFFAFPGIDTRVSGWFYVAGEGFPAAGSDLLNAIRNFGRDTTRLLGIGIVVLLLATLLLPRRMPLPPRATVFLTLSLLLGPLVLVDFTMKEIWGRARPRDILDFGGAFDFSRAWEFASNCSGNCSFVSGEASASIWLVALAFVAPRRWRFPVGLAAFAFALVMSVNRIAFGGHFLSDVVLAWMLTLLVVVLVHMIVYAPAGPFAEARLRRAAIRYGRPLRRRVLPLFGRGPGRSRDP